MARLACAHCGLPVSVGVRRDGAYFCCYGCFIVSRIVGGRDGGTVPAWTVLRLAIGALLSMDVMMLAILLYTGSVERHLEGLFRWLMLLQALPAVAILVYPFVLGAVQEVRRLRLSLDTLIAVGSLTAFAVSTINTITGRGEVYFDSATMLLTLVTFGKLIEAGAKVRARELLHAMESLLPAKATRLQEGLAVEVPLAELRVGDQLLVKPGERFPADGQVFEGHSVVEESAFTGEWQPREITVGSAVIAGTVNGAGVICLRASAVGEQLLLRRIVEMVEQARQQPSRLERQAQRVAAWMVPAVFAAALLSAAAWLTAGEPAKALLSALAVLVVACPCAMGIAAPLATALAIGQAARRGAIVRGGDVLETIGLVRQMFFDKTGTLTTGNPAVSVAACGDDPDYSRRYVQPYAQLQGSQPAPDDHTTGATLAVSAHAVTCPADVVLQLAAAVESASEHVLARAIVAQARRRNLPPLPASGTTILPGLGATGRVVLDGQALNVILGSEKLLASMNLTPDQPLPPLSPGQSQVLVAWDGQIRGTIRFSDLPRPQASTSVQQLQRLGVHTCLLSGDSTQAAAHLANQLGLEEVQAPRRPDEKAATVAAARGRGVVAMVGDGVNDAPALACADVGIALAAGSDLARQAGHVVLVGSDLTVLPELVELSRRTRSIILQNLLWAAGYNAVAIAAAAAGVLHPLLAAVAMVFSSLTVLGNSMRISGKDPSSDAGRGET